MDYVIVAGALRYLANHDRPIGGEQSYNSAHLLQLADQVSRAEADRVAAMMAVPPAATIPGEIATIFTNLLEAAKQTLNECHAPHWRNLLAAIVEAEKIKVADLSAELMKAEVLPSRRTDAEIVAQTNALARICLAHLGTGYEVPKDHKFYEAPDPRSKSAWQRACEIMEHMTATDPNDALSAIEAVLPSPGGEFLPPLDPNWQSVGDVAQQVVAPPLNWTAIELSGQLKMVEAERDMLSAHNATLRAWRGEKLLALLKQGRDLIDEAVHQHIYNADAGEETPDDSPYVAHIEAVDKLLGAAPADADFANVEAHERWKDRGQ